MRVVLVAVSDVVSELLPIVEEDEELGLVLDVVEDVSVEELVEPVPVAPMLVEPLVLAPGLVEPYPPAPMLDVLGDVLEFDVFGFAPPWPADEPVAPADAPVPLAPLVPEDWAIATPPMASAAAAASVVRIFLDMSGLLEMDTPPKGLKLIGKAGALPTAERLNFAGASESGCLQAQPVGPALSQVAAQISA